MPLVKWDSNLIVGIPEIDQQHQILIRIINDVYDSVSSGIENDVLDQSIRHLSDYAQVHFSSEHRLFEEFSYPQMEQHEVEHERFTSKVEELRNDVELAKPDLAIKLISFLTEWLLAHINDSDQKYAAHIKAFDQNKTKSATHLE